MVQTNKVKEKYEYIYGACDVLIRSVVKNETASVDEKYAYLQAAVPAAWAALARGENPLKNPETLSQAITHYTDTPCEMTAGGSTYPTSIGQVELWKRDFICNSLKNVDADCVIELGSGWSHRLVDLWRSGARHSAPHYAC